jgi:hypothetical protein
LPERTLSQLKSIDGDRAKAIVKCVEVVAGTEKHPVKPVEVVEISRGKGVILVGPSEVLRQIKWLRLIEVAPTRYLLTIPTGTPVESLEVAIMDLLENLPQDNTSERVLLEELRKHISHQRRSETVSKGELLFVDV